ncbi:hypothetical protein C0J52_06369 [Blattella germanica]|nr:hypothetical protein C0J52_06369 [Blattella germanica]
MREYSTAFTDYAIDEDKQAVKNMLPLACHHHYYLQPTVNTVTSGPSVVLKWTLPWQRTSRGLNPRLRYQNEQASKPQHRVCDSCLVYVVEDPAGP